MRPPPPGSQIFLRQARREGSEARFDSAMGVAVVAVAVVAMVALTASLWLGLGTGLGLFGPHLSRLLPSQHGLRKRRKKHSACVALCRQLSEVI